MKSWVNSKDMVIVSAARIGPSEVAKTADIEKRAVMRSRRHNGQFSGSLGSSDGCGICWIG